MVGRSFALRRHGFLPRRPGAFRNAVLPTESWSGKLTCQDKNAGQCENHVGCHFKWSGVPRGRIRLGSRYGIHRGNRDHAGCIFLRGRPPSVDGLHILYGSPHLSPAVGGGRGMRDSHGVDGHGALFEPIAHILSPAQSGMNPVTDWNWRPGIPPHY